MQSQVHCGRRGKGKDFLKKSHSMSWLSYETESRHESYNKIVVAPQIPAE